MRSNVLIKTYAPPTINEREVFRYAGCRGEADMPLQTLLQSCIAESENQLSYRICYVVTTAQALLEKWQDTLLCKRLQGAEYAVVFAATIGLGIDRLILKNESVSPTKALLLQALGAERIESLCNVFCEDIQKGCEEKGYTAGARFSAGYGDFSIERQRDIFALLSPQKAIGLTLNDSLLMSPTKSVTAIVPIGKKLHAHTRACAECAKADCEYRENDER